MNAGYEVAVVDNLSNSSFESLRRVQDITGKDVTFFKMDLLDAAGLELLFAQHKFDAVIHFAGYKAVGERTSCSARRLPSTTFKRRSRLPRMLRLALRTRTGGRS